MFGLLHEILDEDGIMWNKRVLGLAAGKRLVEQDIAEGRPDPASWTPDSFARRLQKYSNAESDEHCWTRFMSVLRLIEARLMVQRSNASRFLIGDALTAADLYWAAVTNSFLPLPQEQCPVMDKFRARRRSDPDPFKLLDQLDPVVLEHRNFIISAYFKLPMDF